MFLPQLPTNPSLLAPQTEDIGMSESVCVCLPSKMKCKCHVVYLASCSQGSILLTISQAHSSLECSVRGSIQPCPIWPRSPLMFSSITL
mmetsp:Transcript_41751/g.87176  ORF Transcript_41751/g.87176 Transcript_41751/m.87176 type:complete len:89 (-) Transcript_41751:439-705(-)